MNFLGSLGIDLKLLIAQIVNFVLLLALLIKFLYKPIIARIESDEKELKQAQLQKETLEKQKIINQKKQRQELGLAKKQAREVIAEAENVAKEIRNRAKQEAKQEKEAVIKQIKTRLLEIEYAEKENKKNK